MVVDAQNICEQKILAGNVGKTGGGCDTKKLVQPTLRALVL